MPNQLHDILTPGQWFGNESGRPRRQKAVKRLRHGRYRATCYQKTGQMRTSYRGRIREAGRRRKQSALLEDIQKSLRSLTSTRNLFLEEPRQMRTVHIESIGQDVHFHAVNGTAYFHARREYKTRPPGLLANNRQTLQRVVVGYGQTRKPGRRRHHDDIRRRVHSVRCRRVYVQVVSDHVERQGPQPGLLTEPTPDPIPWNTCGAPGAPGT